jgi:hypothetical protein
MKNLIYKEFHLATLPLTFIFLSFSLMTFIPGYPILCGTFFICLGIFQSYQKTGENNDILYSALLPVCKCDVVKGKYAAAVFIETAAFILYAVFTLTRMAFMSHLPVYTSNFMMSANFVYLAFVLLIFTAFNLIFIGGFFKTSFKTGKPFVIFSIVNFALITLAETLHHLPSLTWLDAAYYSFLGSHLIILSSAFAIYVVSTAFSCRISQHRFENTDL